MRSEGNEIKKLTVAEFAELYRYSKTQVRRWIKAGKLDYIQPNGPGGEIRILWREER